MAKKLTEEQVRQLLEMQKKEMEGEFRDQLDAQAVGFIQEMTAYRRELAKEQEGWTIIGGTKRNRDWATVERDLKECFQAWCINPLAKSFTDYMRYFVIGKGTQMTVPDEDGEDAQDRLSAFLELNEWALLEKQLCEELSRDGEVFVRFHGRNKFGYDTDVMLVTLIDPLEIIAVDRPEAEEVRRYLRRWEQFNEMDDSGNQTSQTMTAWIPAEEIVHIRVNTSLNELRGRSDLQVVLPWLKVHKAWLQDMARRNYMIGSFNWDVTVKPPLTPSTVKAAHGSAPSPGSAIYHTESETWNVLNPDMKYNDSSTGARAVKLQIMGGYKMPESWFGDTGESNLATTQALSLPTLRAFVDRQDLLGFYFDKIVKKGANLENVNIQFPEVVSEEMERKATALKSLSEALNNLEVQGILSRETAYRVVQQYLDELDDWADDESGAGERKRIEDETREDTLAAAQGRRPASGPDMGYEEVGGATRPPVPGE